MCRGCAQGKEVDHNPHPDPIARSKMIQRVWDLRDEGRTYREIAEELGINHQTAVTYFKEGLLANAPPRAEEERILAIRRADEHYSMAQRMLGETADVETKIKILTLMDKLLKSKRVLEGLDAPKKFQHTVHEMDERDLELAELVREMKARGDQQQRRTPRRNAQGR
jgi:predicted transcriptional regulator